MTGSAHDRLAKELAALAVSDTAGDDAYRFESVAKAYFDDRKSALHADGADATLGLGDPVMVGLVTVTLYVADKIVEYYLTVVLSWADRGVLGRLGRNRRAPKSVKELPPLDAEQRNDLRALVRKGAEAYGIATMADAVFEEVVRRLRQEPDDSISS